MAAPERPKVQVQHNGVLLIAEKPSVANRLAAALGKNGAEQRKGKGKVGYYEVGTPGGTIYIAAAVGHLFTIKQSEKGRGYPVLNVEWAPSYKVDKRSEFTKEYLDLLQELAKKCDRFINACDFDIEGTVIGTNIIKYLNNGDTGGAQRMKFSTTTTGDLLNSYQHMMPLDIDNFRAGEARHMLDWLWGINLSRALTYAMGHGTYGSHALSIGRVQGPSLAILAKRELEIAAFVPKPFWRIAATINGTEFMNSRGDMFEKQIAESAMKESQANRTKAVIEEVESREQAISPYPPFDLTSLQLEASRALHLDPTITLSIAQSLYEKAYISYPRTSSQKLPASLDLPRIISGLARNREYAELAKSLMAQKRYKPVEGAKTDEAHPSIFPTGETPSGLSQQEARLYDLIARRFLACFAEAATVSRAKVVAKLGKESYSASGSIILKKGWLDFYTYAKIDEKTLPPFKKGESHPAQNIELRNLQTQPPRRYTKAGLISELEKRDLGTKATRSQIIDTLFRRKYIDGTSIHATEFGMSVYKALADNCAMIVDEETTRKLEVDMDRISKGQVTEKEVIDEGKEMLLRAIEQFDKNKTQIGQELKVSLVKSNILGKCPKDGGDLVIRRSRAGKQFAACANYPACTNTYSLPQNALILPTGQTCEHCKTPIIKVIRKGMRPFEMDLDPTCVSKKEWAGYKSAADIAAEAKAPVAPKAVPQAKPVATAVQSTAHQAVPALPVTQQRMAPEPAKEKPAAKATAKKARPKAKARSKPAGKSSRKKKTGGDGAETQ